MPGFCQAGTTLKKDHSLREENFRGKLPISPYERYHQDSKRMNSLEDERTDGGDAGREEGDGREDGQQEGRIREEEDTETIMPRIARRPKNPTSKQREEHEILHESYEEWCPHCRAGQGKASPHKKQEEDRTSKECVGTTISVDFCFMAP